MVDLPSKLLNWQEIRVSMPQFWGQVIPTMDEALRIMIEHKEQFPDATSMPVPDLAFIIEDSHGEKCVFHLTIKFNVDEIEAQYHSTSDTGGLTRPSRHCQRCRESFPLEDLTDNFCDPCRKALGKA